MDEDEALPEPEGAGGEPGGGWGVPGGGTRGKWNMSPDAPGRGDAGPRRVLKTGECGIWCNAVCL